MRISNMLQLGKAGEHLVCADVILKGLISFTSEQGLPYDVLIDNGKRLIRCQVKTTQGHKRVPQRNKESMCYVFNIKRCGKSNKKRYGLNEIDVFAFVDLNTRTVGYLKNEHTAETINLRVEEFRGSYHDERGVKMYTEVMKLWPSTSQTEIAKKLGIHIATVNRMCQPGYKPFQTNAPYLTDLIRSKEWFNEL